MDKSGHWDENLFLALNKWAKRQDENFTTDVFAYVLKYLLRTKPVLGVSMLSCLTDGELAIDGSQAARVEIATQLSGSDTITESKKRPDITISLSESHRVYVEVKVGAGVEITQLEHYQRMLDDSGFPHTTLVLLTKNSADLSDEIRSLCVMRQWQDVHNELSRGRQSVKWEDEDRVTLFLIDQFMGFLGGKNMTMQRINWQLPEGIRSLSNLLQMLAEAISALGHKPGFNFGSCYMGYKIKQEGKYWVGVTFDKPKILLFQTENTTIDKGAAKTLNQGYIRKNGDWIFEMDLESEEVHFFARSPESQLEAIKEHIRKGIEYAKSIELRE